MVLSCYCCGMISSSTHICLFCWNVNVAFKSRLMVCLLVDEYRHNIVDNLILVKVQVKWFKLYFSFQNKIITIWKTYWLTNSLAYIGNLFDRMYLYFARWCRWYASRLYWTRISLSFFNVMKLHWIHFFPENLVVPSDL